MNAVEKKADIIELAKRVGALARKHAKRLRLVALVLVFFVPCALAAVAFLLPAARVACLVAAALLFQLGALVERWLFFAQARHTIATYYGVESP